MTTSFQIRDMNTGNVLSIFSDGDWLTTMTGARRPGRHLPTKPHRFVESLPLSTGSFEHVLPIQTLLSSIRFASLSNSDIGRWSSAVPQSGLVQTVLETQGAGFSSLATRPSEAYFDARSGPIVLPVTVPGSVR